jgi:hypothetical protein
VYGAPIRTLNPSNFGSSIQSPPCGHDRIAVLSIGSGAPIVISLDLGVGGRAAGLQRMWEHTFVRFYGFRVTEHDPERPWVIVGSGRHRVELEADIDFYEWVREQWPPDRFTVELDPWSLTPK